MLSFSDKCRRYTYLVFYHARVILKPEQAKGSSKIAFEADMTREDLLKKVAVPFAKGEQFFCGGVVVQPSKVQEVKFNQTEQSSTELLPIIGARRRLSGVVSTSFPVWQIAWEGQDITREILDESKAVTVSSSQPELIAHSDRVFIVHGHDDQALDQTELLIRRFGLTPIILRETANAGQTVIEKFETHSDVGFAMILLTPDDFGGVSMDRLARRARQNVIWEWGYLVGRLGRGRVVCLYKGSVEMPSDLLGLVTIHIGDDVRGSAEEIRRELTGAGYRIA